MLPFLRKEILGIIDYLHALFKQPMQVKNKDDTSMSNIYILPNPCELRYRLSSTSVDIELVHYFITKHLKILSYLAV